MAAILLCLMTFRCESFSESLSASRGVRITASRVKLPSSSKSTVTHIPLYANEIDEVTAVSKSTSLGNLKVPPTIPSAVERVSSSSSAFERVQRGLARLSKAVPKTVILTVVAVASGLIFFELTKTLLLLALPVIAVLGKDLSMPVVISSSPYQSQSSIIVITVYELPEYCPLLPSPR